MSLRSTEVYVVEYHAGGGGTSRRLLCDYAPHFYRLEAEDGTEVYLTLVSEGSNMDKLKNGLEGAVPLPGFEMEEVK